MTSYNKFILSTLIISSITISGCSSHSSNGISETFKENYLRECKKNAEVNLSPSSASDYCNCTLGIVLGKFNSDKAAERYFNQLTLSELQEFIAPCIE